MSAAFSSGRNASNSTAASNASRWSPRSLNRFNRSSTSKNPACLRIESSPIHPPQWNQKGGEFGEVLRTIQLGFGYHKGTKTPEQWARDFVAWLDNYCFYRSRRTILAAFRRHFSVTLV